MHPIASPQTLQAAMAHLAKQDSVLAPVIERFGVPTITPSTDYYQSLVDSIISQQLSVHAARSIENRFRELFGGHFPSADEVLAIDLETLRGLGFSYAKGRYVLDLAQHVINGAVRFDHMDSLSNAEIIAELTAVKGIGEWTAHMFLLFCMGRLDVLPVGDLGIKNGIRKLYELAAVPSPQDITQLAADNSWYPYESVASWYIWQSLDNAPAVKA